MLKSFLLFPLLFLILISMPYISDSSAATTERGTEFAIIEIQDISEHEWLQDQQLTITLTDEDMNKDSTSIDKILFPTAYDFVYEEHPDLDPADFLYKKLGSIPYLGYSLGLTYSGNASFENTGLDNYQSGDNVIVITTPNSITAVANGNSFLLQNTIPSNINQYDTESNLKHFINYDFSSLNQKLSNGGIISFNITLEDESNSVILVESTSNFKDYFLLDNTKLTEIKNTLSGTSYNLRINLENVQSNTQYDSETILPLVLDVFRFGVTGSGDNYNNYLLEYTLRLELEETGIDTGVFTGTIAYKRITSENIETFDYASLNTFGKNIVFPTFPDAMDEDSPRINYFDFGMDGILTNIAAQQGVYNQPIWLPISIETDEDTPVHFQISGTNGEGGIVWGDGRIATGKIVYDYNSNDHIFTPIENYFGSITDSVDFQEIVYGTADFEFQVPVDVTITVKPSDDPPLLNQDDSSSTQHLNIVEDVYTEITINNRCDSQITHLIGCQLTSPAVNVYNPDNDELIFSVIQNPSHGQVTGTNKIFFTPEQDYVGTDSMILKFSDGVTETENMNISINITPMNDIPLANAGIDQTVDSNTTITLDGTNSLDVDGDTITYNWVQTSGYLVTLTDSTIANPQFSIPNIDDTLTFMLTVSDGTATSNPDMVNILVGTLVNNIPLANAGIDQTVNVNSLVQLDGTNSSDSDDDTITYHWIQTAGYPVTLTDSTIANPQFTSPDDVNTLTFMLTVSDGTATSNPDVINIYVGESVPEPTAPPAPSSLNTNPTDSAVVLTWQNSDDGGSPITDYVIEYKSESDDMWSVYNDGTTSSTTSIVSGLENNLSAYFNKDLH